jgi:hydrogenase maturation protein HypF
MTAIEVKDIQQRRRMRHTFRGIIQGVGFRPTVYRCALRLRLAGLVRNQRSEVIAEIEGNPDALAAFLPQLRIALPAAAVLDSVESTEIPPLGDRDFRIVESLATRFSFPPIPPDLATCPECRAELLDSRNRRYLYPFITCTQCGPRYSIVQDTPFDRATTSMAEFSQCPECRREYEDPTDRRFHSQTNSCRSCGPSLRLLRPSGREAGGDPIREAIAALEDGLVVALQGIGGFHLAADPRFDSAVRRLRQDKDRQRKPFALMVADLEEAGRLCALGAGHAERLASPASPILILPLAPGTPDYLQGVSDTGTLGVMLPYTPLHLLLFHHPASPARYRHLIMTSGNLRGEPIITDPLEARTGLAEVADLFLVHNRRIVFRADDSVERGAPGGPTILLRRSRGHVPRLISLLRPLEKTVLAAGGDLKNAPALGRGRDVYLAPYIGDLEDPATRSDFEKQIDKILGLYGVRPEVLVHDLHPGYHSTRWALGVEGVEKRGVQHHHAHVLAVMAEHGLEETLGLAFDGTGYGDDGTIWGGEVLHARRGSYRRLGCFEQFPLPGGEAAVRHPVRSAVALLSGVLDSAALSRLFCERLQLPADELETLLQMIHLRLNSPMTSSLGRIFDAAAALLGLVRQTTYEGEGPIRLEGRALQFRRRAGTAPIEPRADLCRSTGADGTFHIDAAPLLAELAELNARGRGDCDEAAFIFHREVAAAALAGAERARELTGLRSICLSGGVFQNQLLVELLVPALERAGFAVHTHRQLPPGDGGIAVGQVYFLPETG